MRKFWIAGMICMALAGCTQTEGLAPEDAARVIRREMNYPKPYVYDIFCADPGHARKVLDAGLEKDSLLVVSRRQKMGEAGKSLIGFTPKASPYLMASSEEDARAGIRKVRIADEDMVRVTSVTTGGDGATATVEYTTAYSNVTPFAALVRTDMKKEVVRTVRLALDDNDGWRLAGKR